MEVTEHAGEIIIIKMLLNSVKKVERESKRCQCPCCKLFWVLEDVFQIKDRPDIMLFHCLRRSERLSNQNWAKKKCLQNFKLHKEVYPGRRGQVHWLIFLKNDNVFTTAMKAWWPLTSHGTKESVKQGEDVKGGT